MNILFIGDIVGKVGRRVVSEQLPIIKAKYDIDFVVANGENVTHGKGLSIKHYLELKSYGIDCVTMGNHYLRNRDVFAYRKEYIDMVRPANMYPDIPGKLFKDFTVKGKNIRIINVLGRAFLDGANDNPYDTVENLRNLPVKPDMVFVDFHAESTAEKMIMGKVFDGKITGVVGTHTHTQTNDARILPNGTAFISDLGMCGYYDGVLGVKPEGAIQRTWKGEPSRFDVPETGRGSFNGLVMHVDEEMIRVTELTLINRVDKE